MFRALVARANYLSQDRYDSQFAVEELCRKMSDPTEADWEKLKRLGRYLIGRSRLIVQFPYQFKPNTLVIYTDTDFASCERTRKSTSGGLLKVWGTPSENMVFNRERNSLVLG